MLSTLRQLAFPFLICILTLATVIATILVNSQTNPVSLTTQVQKTLEYGIIDPQDKYSNATNLKYESIYWDWEKDTSGLISILDTIQKRKRIPIVFVEPSQYLGQTKFPFNKIIEGNYDQALTSVCSAIGNTASTIIVSFAPNMDVDGSTKNWVQDDSFGYISAYRYFVSKCKKIANNTKYLWSPKGTGNAQKFYPGGKFVDYIGLSVTATSKEKREFRDIYDSAYVKVKDYKKPVFITELGVSGDTEYVKTWMDKAKNRLQDVDLQRYTRVIIYNQGPDVSGQNATEKNLPNYTLTNYSFPF